MYFVIVTMVAAIALAVGMSVLFRVGRRFGARNLPEAGDAWGRRGRASDLRIALHDLLIAFTFSGAAERFDARRRMITGRATCDTDAGPARVHQDVRPGSNANGFPTDTPPKVVYGQLFALALLRRCLQGVEWRAARPAPGSTV
ncbi:MAG TPA: hypothetical protein VF516_20665 [Kofleriaceae bacterium]